MALHSDFEKHNLLILLDCGRLTKRITEQRSIDTVLPAENYWEVPRSLTIAESEYSLVFAKLLIP